MDLLCQPAGLPCIEQAASALRSLADGVIVGSACVKTIVGSEKPVEAAREFAKSFREALQ